MGRFRKGNHGPAPDQEPGESEPTPVATFAAAEVRLRPDGMTRALGGSRSGMCWRAIASRKERGAGVLLTTGAA